MTGIDVHKLIRYLLPTFLRKPLRMAWLEALLAPFAAMWTTYAGWRAEKYYEANVTAQTLSMEAYLNRLFDTVEKRIRIRHGEDKGVYVSLRSEGYDLYYIDGEEGAFIALEGEQDERLFGFTAVIPATLSGRSAEIESAVRNIKAAGVPFEMESVMQQPAAPPAPTLESKTYHSITLEAIDGYEYSIDGLPWQNSSTFDGLMPGTTHTFTQRIAETEGSYASPASEQLQETVLKQQLFMAVAFDNDVVVTYGEDNAVPVYKNAV